MWTSTNPSDLLDMSSSSSNSTTMMTSSSSTSSTVAELLEKTTHSVISQTPPSPSSTSTPTPLAAQFNALVEIEGAGSWPPRPARPSQEASSSSPSNATASSSSSSSASSCSWWEPYHSLALSVASSGRFVDSNDGLHPRRSESTLRVRIDENRRWLSDQLDEVVGDVDDVMRVLEHEAIRASSIDNDDLLDSPTAASSSSSSSSSCLGFLACLAYLAHLYRWGTLPVVSLAQDERTLELPKALSRPMEVLSDRYGLKTSGGCLWTMTLLNVDPHNDSDDGIVYSNMRHLRDTFPDAWDAERLNALIFYDMERLAVPFYRSIATLENESLTSEQVAETLATANASLKAAFKLFFDTVREGRIKKDVWMSHAQGFHGWGIDDFDGVSGDHSLLIRTLDAFLAIPKHTLAEVTVPSPELEGTRQEAPVSWPSWVASWVFPWRWRATTNSHAPPPPPPTATTFTEVPYSDDYLPRQQVAWISAVRRANLRPRLARDAPIELAETIRLLRLWRAAHTRKAVYYENLDLPERRPMTASGGVGGGVGDGKTEGVGEMIRKLEARLKARIEATQ